jgi:hypothetical protein
MFGGSLYILRYIMGVFFLGVLVFTLIVHEAHFICRSRQLSKLCLCLPLAKSMTSFNFRFRKCARAKTSHRNRWVTETDDQTTYSLSIAMLITSALSLPFSPVSIFVCIAYFLSLVLLWTEADNRSVVHVVWHVTISPSGYGCNKEPIPVYWRLQLMQFLIS